jgi:hypothetical protein
MRHAGWPLAMPSRRLSALCSGPATEAGACGFSGHGTRFRQACPSACPAACTASATASCATRRAIAPATGPRCPVASLWPKPPTGPLPPPGRALARRWCGRHGSLQKRRAQAGERGSRFPFPPKGAIPFPGPGSVSRQAGGRIAVSAPCQGQQRTFPPHAFRPRPSPLGPAQRVPPMQRGQSARPAPGPALAFVASVRTLLMGPWSMTGRQNALRFGVRPELQVAFPADQHQSRPASGRDACSAPRWGQDQTDAAK